MGFVATFKLNRILIKTTVTNNEKKVDEILCSFLHESDNATKVIGFDIELKWLHHMYGIPISLLNFLRQADYIFVSIGIKGKLAKLEKSYGLACSNAVELGHMATTIRKNPRLEFCGVDELALVINNFDVRKERPLTAIKMDWDYGSNELAQLATINVYSYYKNGSTLLVGDGKIIKLL